MERTLQFGNVDLYNAGHKINAVEITISLTDDRLSITGGIWNAAHTDMLSAGQNLNTIAELLPNDETVQRIVKIWERWHLNDMRAGTPAQEAVLREQPRGLDYTQRCRVLADAGLLVVGRSKGWKGYKYGSAWLTEPLPADVRAEVEGLISSGPSVREQTYVEREGIAVRITRGRQSDPKLPAYTYRLKLTRSDGRTTPPFDWRQGIALTNDPTAEEVLSALASDATSYLEADSFEDFAANFGYEIDTYKERRQAEKVYKACAETNEWLQEFLGDDFEMVAYN